MGSALVPPPGIPPADGSDRRWDVREGWVPYRRFVRDPDGGGRLVPVAGVVPCAFEGFLGIGIDGRGDLEFFSHHWGEGGYEVAEALTGYGLTGTPGGRTDSYARRGEAIDAAESELRRIGRETLRVAVADVLASREAA